MAPKGPPPKSIFASQKWHFPDFPFRGSCSGTEKAHKHKQLFPMIAWVGPGGQRSSVYVLCAKLKEHKHFRPGTQPEGSVTGVTQKLFMCQMFMCLFWPLLVCSSCCVLCSPLLQLFQVLVCLHCSQDVPAPCILPILANPFALSLQLAEIFYHLLLADLLTTAISLGRRLCRTNLAPKKLDSKMKLGTKNAPKRP